MKTPSPDNASNGEGEDIFDFENFFSVLMFYGHMSKEDILNSSIPFLRGIYKNWGKRACENLGVSYDKSEDDNKSVLTEKDYPVEFKKLGTRERQEAAESYGSDQDFLSGFSEFNQDKYINLKTF